MTDDDRQTARAKALARFLGGCARMWRKWGGTRAGFLRAAALVWDKTA